jgi:hypothetical protein
MAEPILNARIGRVRPAWTADAAPDAAAAPRVAGAGADGGACSAARPRRVPRFFVGACLLARVARFAAAAAARWVRHLRGRPLTPAREPAR